MNRVNALKEMIPDESKPMKMRDKHPPKSQIPPFHSPQADFWEDKEFDTV